MISSSDSRVHQLQRHQDRCQGLQLSFSLHLYRVPRASSLDSISAFVISVAQGAAIWIWTFSRGVRLMLIVSRFCGFGWRCFVESGHFEVWSYSIFLGAFWFEVIGPLVFWDLAVFISLDFHARYCWLYSMSASWRPGVGNDWRILTSTWRRFGFSLTLSILILVALTAWTSWMATKSS